MLVSISSAASVSTAEAYFHLNARLFSSAGFVSRIPLCLPTLMGSDFALIWAAPPLKQTAQAACNNEFGFGI